MEMLSSKYTSMFQCCQLKDVTSSTRKIKLYFYQWQKYIFVLHFAQVDSIVAIPASIKSVETVIVKIVDQSTNESERKIFDDWGQMIKGWQSFLGTHYLCKSS